MAEPRNEMLLYIQNFTKDFEQAVKGLEAKYGCEIKLGNISYTSVDFSSKMTVVRKVNGKSAEQVEFEKYCRAYGFSPSDYGRKVKSKPGTDYIFVGFAPKARTYPYLVRCVKTGAGYKFKSENFTLL